jgi:hypothetical protein
VVDAVRSITEGTRHVETLVDRIQAASEGQAHRIQQITTALSRMDGPRGTPPPAPDKARLPARSYRRNRKS